MAEGSGCYSERETLGRSAKFQHKYGSSSRTSSTSTYPEQFVKHIVQQDETLAGIALKYGCTMQQLKQLNGIHCDWQFASLKIIFIPVLICGGQALNKLDEDLVTRPEMLRLQKMTRSTSDGTIAKDQSAFEKDSVKNYFSKFDSSLAEIKDSMDKLSHSIHVRQEDLDNPLLMLPTKKSSRQLNGVWNSDVESLEPTQEPGLRFMSQPATDCGTTNGGITTSNSRTVRTLRPPLDSKWQQMELTHDELFEL